MSRQAADELLAAFAGTVGLDECSLDPEGYCHLQFDELDVHLQLDDGPGELVLFCRLGGLDGEPRPEVYETLLAANLFWAGTNGGTLSLEPTDGSVYLATKTLVAGLEYPDFESWLGGFVAAADRWTANLATLGAGGSVSPEDSDTGQEPRQPRFV